MKKLIHYSILAIFLLIILPHQISSKEIVKQSLQKREFKRAFNTKEELTPDARAILERLKTKKRQNLQAFAERKAAEWETNHPKAIERAKTLGLKIS